MIRAPLTSLPEPFASNQGLFTPRSLPGLSVWLDAADLATVFGDASIALPVTADGQPVGAWLDKSPNGLAATQTSAVRRPTYRAASLNGRPAIEFDGVDDWLTETGWLLNQPNTVVFVANRSTSVGYTIDGGTVNGRHSFYVTATEYALRAGGTEVRGGLWDTAAHVHCTIVDGANTVYRIDGAQIFAANPGPSALEGLSLGANYAGSTRMAGCFGELIVYNRRLSSPEIARLETYLRRKWRTA